MNLLYVLIPLALLILGGLVTVCSFCAFLVRFSVAAESEAAREYSIAAYEKRQGSEALQPEPALT